MVSYLRILVSIACFTSSPRSVTVERYQRLRLTEFGPELNGTERGYKPVSSHRLTYYNTLIFTLQT